MTRVYFAKLMTAAALAATMTGSAFAADSSLKQGELQHASEQAKAEGKLLVVALCPGSESQCAPYLQSFRQSASSVMFRDWAIFVAPDLSLDADAAGLAQQRRAQNLEVVVFGPDQKELWLVRGMGTGSEIAGALDRGVCAATVHNAPQIPPAFRNKNGAVCQAKAEGVSWSPEPEVIRRPQ